MERGSKVTPLSLYLHLACAIDRTVAEKSEIRKFHFFGLALESFLEEVSQYVTWLGQRMDLSLRPQTGVCMCWWGQVCAKHREGTLVETRG